ncbi:MAG: HEAT repeat domain-containing protein, partial [Deltaproteobacteria bacterium]
RLGQLAPALSAPVIAAAMGRLRRPAILCHLLRLAGRTELTSISPLVQEELGHPDDSVRAAALWAFLRLPPPVANGAPEATVAALEQAAVDPSPRVRRAAALGATLSRPEAAQPLLERLSTDPAPEVRKLTAGCAAALPVSQGALLRRLGNDEAPAVRAAALRALRAVPSVAELPAAERRKALRGERTPKGAPAADGSAELAERITSELRASLRGCTVGELSARLSVPTGSVTRAIERAGASRFVRRGEKVFLA